MGTYLGTYQSDLKALGPDKLYQRLSESIKNAKGAYGVYLTAVLLVMTTVMTIAPDAYLVRSELSLPIIGLKVRFFWFYLVSPIVLLASFLYLHTTLKSTKLYLDVIHQDCGVKPVNASPWFVTNDYVMRLYRNKRFDVRTVFVELSLWFSLPIVLMVFSLSAVKYHDPLIFWSSVPFFAFSVWLSLHFRRRFKRPLGTHFHWWKSLAGVLVGFLCGALLAGLNYMSEHGKRRTWMTFFYTNIVNENLVLEKSEGLNGIVLDGKNLNNARFEGVVLQNARGTEVQFRGADLSNVNFQGSRLQGVDFGGARLDGCNFSDSDLFRASFEGAVLEGCVFNNSQIQRARFRGATLVDCKFFNLRTKLQDVKRALQDVREIAGDTRFDSEVEAVIEKSN